MIETEKIKVEREEEKTIKAFCSFCKKEFDARTTLCNGFGQMRISFGFGSSFDDDHFFLEICDDCFLRNYYHLLKPQFKMKKYNLVELEKMNKDILKG